MAPDYRRRGVSPQVFRPTHNTPRLASLALLYQHLEQWRSLLLFFTLFFSLPVRDFGTGVEASLFSFVKRMGGAKAAPPPRCSPG